jgi:hypothetical protein
MSAENDDRFLLWMEKATRYARSFWLLSATLFLPVIAVVLLAYVAQDEGLRDNPAIVTSVISVLATSIATLFLKQRQ